MRSLKPAVAVMAKVPGATAVKSRLHPSLTAEQATELYRCFLHAVLGPGSDGRARPAGIPADSPAGGGPRRTTLEPSHAPPRGRPSRGNRDRQRQPNAADGLCMDYVVEGARALEKDAADLVLGPCDDGGYYFVGLRAPRPALFQGSRGARRGAPVHT